MLHYPFDTPYPVALKIGPLKVHWYGLMYLVAAATAWFLAWIRARKSNSEWTIEQISDLVFFGALGAVLGGRIGYMLFYDFSNFISQPWVIFKVWQGGMSFHGGLIGAICGLWFVARKFKKPFWDVGDFTAPLIPLGLGAGRLGNFINGELWGRVTNVPWGMVFPQAGPLPRHPSQLYEFFFEGIVLFVIVWWYSAKPKPRMAVSGMFLLWYGIFRFCIEFFRQPDVQLGFVAFNWMTQGQLLSIPMILAGAFILVWAYRRKCTSKVGCVKGGAVRR